MFLPGESCKLLFPSWEARLRSARLSKSVIIETKFSVNSHEIYKKTNKVCYIIFASGLTQINNINDKKERVNDQARERDRE